MVKTTQGLNLFYPEMLPVTCLVLHSLSEEIRKNFPDVYKLIPKTRKNLCKTLTEG